MFPLSNAFFSIVGLLFLLGVWFWAGHQRAKDVTRRFMFRALVVLFLVALFMEVATRMLSPALAWLHPGAFMATAFGAVLRR